MMPLKPTNGGYRRPFGAAWFVIEFLKGHAPEDSKKIDPGIGAPMVDIHFEYKTALHRLQAQDAVEREEEKRIKRGLPAYTDADYSERLKFFSNRIPYKLFKMRYASFTRYFGQLKRLGWVVESGIMEPSAIQDDYPPAPSRVYYKLTPQGWAASPSEISDPLMTLYHYSREQRSAKRHAYFKV